MQKVDGTVLYTITDSCIRIYILQTDQACLVLTLFIASFSMYRWCTAVVLTARPLFPAFTRFAPTDAGSDLPDIPDSDGLSEGLVFW